MTDKRIEQAVPEWAGETEFELDGVRFFIDKFSAMDGAREMERLRRMIGQARVALPDGADGAAALIAALVHLPDIFDSGLVARHFARVRFAGQGATAPQPLAGAEDMAFAGSEPIAIYEVLARCLAVNFFESGRRLLDLVSPPPATTSRRPPS